MTAQLLGEKRSSRRRWTLLLPLIAAFTLGMFYVAGAQAVHDDSYIQLDRNALTGDTSNGTAVPSPAAAHDWDQVYADRNDPDCTVSEADACSWNHDEPEASIFVGGGSKDTLDITGWQWKNGSVPDKDNLLDAYAARYGDDLFFGADRFDGNGTATLGVWFFQGDVGPTGTATGGGFSGTHLNNDILVLTDFQASGANATVRVFRWEVPFVTPGCSSNPCLIAGDAITPADCVGPPRVPNGDSRCGTTNARVEISPWAFTPKVGPTGFFPVGHFFEGGIDLRPFGLADSCFSTFLAETRTSNSIGSQLKDFVTGQLAHCSGAITTQVSDSAVTPGTAVHDTATVTGSNPNNDPEGDVTFFLCTFAVGSTDECDGTTGKVGTSIGTGTLAGQGGGISTADSPNVNTAASPKLPGRYCFRAEWPGDDNYPAAPPEFSAATECFTVSKIDTQAASTPVDSSGASQSTIVLGGSIYDKVDITGTTAGG